MMELLVFAVVALVLVVAAFVDESLPPSDADVKRKEREWLKR